MRAGTLLVVGTYLLTAAVLTACVDGSTGGAAADVAVTSPAPPSRADRASTAPSPPRKGTASGTTPPTSAAGARGTGHSATGLAGTTTTSTTTTGAPIGTTTSTATTVTPGPVWFDLDADTTTIGYSVRGRPIVAERIGPRGGRPVVVIGVIHGDEADGTAVIDALRAGPAVDGIELWLVRSMNPDGEAAGTRGNADGVDLNRNFPYAWAPLGQPGDPEYAGPEPASEPETRSIVNLLTVLRPDITIWYHQDLFTISPSTGRDGRIRTRYAELTGLPLERITGGTYTGVAATWAREELGPGGGVAFIVELGPTLSPARAEIHADAVRTIAAEG